MSTAGFLIIGAVASLAGGLIQAQQMQAAAAAQAAAVEYQARFQKAAADYEAGQRERQANDARAIAQREAIKRRREGEILMSRQLAVAASQGGATDPSVLNLYGDTFEETELAAGTEIYKGESRARGFIEAANVRRYEGEQALIAGRMRASALRTQGRYQAIGAIIGGIGGAAGALGQINSGGGSSTSGLRYG